MAVAGTACSMQTPAQDAGDDVCLANLLTMHRTHDAVARPGKGAAELGPELHEDLLLVRVLFCHRCSLTRQNCQCRCMHELSAGFCTLCYSHTSQQSHRQTEVWTLAAHLPLMDTPLADRAQDIAARWEPLNARLTKLEDSLDRWRADASLASHGGDAAKAGPTGDAPPLEGGDPGLDVQILGVREDGNAGPLQVSTPQIAWL